MLCFGFKNQFMRNIIISLIIFISFSSSFLCAEDSLTPDVVAATDGDPGAVMGGCVNGITGDFIFGKEDLVVKGAVPLVLRRSYVSGNGSGRDSGWQFLPHFIIECPYYEQRKRLTSHIIVTEPSGSSMMYAFWNERKENAWVKLTAMQGRHSIGLTNNSSGTISGRTNLKNIRVMFKERLKHTSDFVRAFNKTHKYTLEAVVTTGEGLRRYYEKCRHVERNHSYQLTLFKEELPNGCWILYENDEYARPTFARVVSPDQKKTFAWARFHYDGSDDRDHNFRIETSDGQNIRYGFDRKSGSPYRFYLRDVTGSVPCAERYHAKETPKYFNPLLSEIWQASHLIQKMFYYYPQQNTEISEKNHPVCNRIKEIQRSLGSNDNLVTTHQLRYNIGKWHSEDVGFKCDGSTILEGADGLKQELYWSKHLRPTRTLLYDTAISSDTPQIIHQAIWGAELSPEMGNLKARALLDAGQRVMRARTFTYDSYHNPTRETFYGNLSGSYIGDISLDSEGKVQGGETYGHTYSYSSDRFHLLLEDREDNGRVTSFHYFPDSALLSARFISDGRSICQRTLYEYDSDHLLTAEINDDGTSGNPQDLCGVKTRQIRRTIRRSDGMPERVEERYYDVASSQEKCLKTTILHYSAQLHVNRQDILDAQGTLCYSLFFEYDNVGRVIAKSDPLGHWTRFTYDEQGRCTRIEHTEEHFDILQTYDVQGNLLQVEQVTHDGLKHTESYLYNALGSKVATIDYLGNITRHHPDPLGRSKGTDYPNGSQERFEYDAMSCPVRQISRSGAVTTARYNAYGNPLEIHHPDGSEEHFSYNPDGMLRESIGKLGARTVLDYDILGRIVHKQVFDTQDHLLTQEQHIYDGLQLRAHIDAEGNKNTFEYDGAGRKIAEHKNNATTRFLYDTLGRLACCVTEEWRKEYLYDLLDRVLCERIYASDNCLQKEITYSYDERGNRTEVALTTSQGKSVETTIYDTLNRPIAIIDPLGSATRFFYDESISNILRKITIDPIGTKTTETLGSMGERLSLEIESMVGKKLLREEFSYDLAGNCTEHKSYLPRGMVVTSREFDPNGKVLTLTEAAGTSEEKITRYEYLPGGLLHVLRKNDGTALYHEYDALGRMTLCSSAKEGYRYSYDALSRITQVEDLSTHLISTRSYDALGQIAEERFLHGMTIGYNRDSRGRPTHMQLPDGSSVAYTWNGIHLKDISRFDQNGYRRYRHSYVERDLSGRPTISRLIGNLGTEERHYDLAQRLNVCKTPFHTEQALSRNALGHMLSTRGTTSLYTEENQYRYDALQQLQEEQGTFSHTYIFDPHSTLLCKDGRETISNGLYQLLRLGSNNYSYDHVGRLSQESNRSYHYDIFDRLIAIEEPTQRIEYAYDSWHRRVQKRVYRRQNNQWNQQTTHFYLYDGMLEIGATDTDGQFLELRILGSTTQAETVAIELLGHAYAPLYDLRGNIVGLVDPDTKTLKEAYRYSAFGEIRALTARQNPWTFSGKRFDSETGLIYFGRRYYHPTLSKWITPDPVGAVDRPNLYAFLRGNPIAFFDAVGYASQTLDPDHPAHFTYHGETAVSKGLVTGFSTMGKAIGYPIYHAAYHLPVPIVRDAIVSVGAKLSQNPSYGVFRSHVIEYPGNNAYPRLTNTFINGICNTPEDIKEPLKFISEQFDGATVNAAYNSTHGFGIDMMQSASERFFGTATHGSDNVYRLIISNHDKLANQFSDGNFACNYFVHSEGNLQMGIALQQVRAERPEILSHVHFYSFGTPKIFHESTAKTMQHYLSASDLLRLCMPLSSLQNHDHVTILQPSSWNPMQEHGFMGETYKGTMGNVCREIKKQWRD